MATFQSAEVGVISLIRQTSDGRIQQIAVSKEQSLMINNFLAIISQNTPLVEMGEEHDLILKSSIAKPKSRRNKQPKR